MTETSISQRSVRAEPPLSRPIRLGVALCLGAGAVLAAVPQYVEHLRAGDLERKDQIAWGLAHAAFYRVEWLSAMVASFLLLLGFLGLWQVTRWSAPRLTAIGAVVLLWGMSGQIFSETATYTAQVVTADTLGAGAAEQLVADGYLHDSGMITVVVVPVIVGMFLGVILLAIALWRSGFPKTPVVVLALWPLWDFFGPSRLGVFTPDLLLLVAGVWLAFEVVRLPHDRWLGRGHVSRDT